MKEKRLGVFTVPGPPLKPHAKYCSRGINVRAGRPPFGDLSLNDWVDLHRVCLSTY